MNNSIFLCIIIIAILILLIMYPSNNNREHFQESPQIINDIPTINPEEIITAEQEIQEPPSIMSNMNTWYSNEWIDHIDENGNPVYSKREESEPIDNYKLITDMPISVEPFENEPISFVYDRFSGL